MFSLSFDVVEPDAFASVAAEIAALEASTRDATGHAALGEAVWRDLHRPQPDSAGVAARDRGSRLVAYVHASRSDTFAPRHWAFGAVAAIDAPDAALTGALRAAAAHVAARGGGTLVLWWFGAGGGRDAALEACGFHVTRELYEMRVPLPLPEAVTWPPGVEVRTFEPGRDEDAWLEVNNRAFGNHPEQGGWIRATLERRMAEPWFDASLFLLAFDGQGLAGFNWLKIHEGHGRDPALGEIFVIGVDPRMQGSGLGRALAVAGLALVAARGVTTGELFVAAENTAAVRLYRSLGFTVHRTDRAYELEVAAA
jgi:mycothiol synthase